MAVTQTPLRQFQWGKESTRGTAVAATSPIFGAGITFRQKDRLLRPKLARGYMMRNQGAETPVERWTEFDAPAFPMAFDQLPHWLSMAVQGGVTPAGPVDSAYTWTFVRAATDNPTPDAWTLERRLSSGGGTTKDTEFSFALLREITIKGGENKEVTIEANGFCRRRQNSALTPALTPIVGHYSSHALSRLYIDDTAGGIGVGLVSTQLLDWSVKFMTGNTPIWTADNRSDLDYPSAGIDGDKAGFEFEATFLVNAQYSAEQIAAEAIDGGISGGLRAMRLEVNHPVLIGAATTRRLRVDMIGRAEDGTVLQVGSRYGQDIVTVKYQETPGANFISYEVKNAASALT